MTEHKLTCDENGVRLDKFLSVAEIGLSRSMAVNLIESENVTVNGKPSGSLIPVPDKPSDIDVRVKIS